MNTTATTDLLQQASMRKHGKTFYWASFFLGSRRHHVLSLYQLCRYVDDVADTASDATMATSALEALRRDLANENTSVAFVKQAIALKNHADLPLSALDLLICEARDEHPFQQPRNEDDLIAYAFGVAGSVGYMMRPLLGCSDAKANHAAVALGIAMQLTNIARDIGEDARIGRIYVPANWHENANIDFLLRNTPHVSSTAQQWAKRLLVLADQYYLQAESGLHYLPLGSRLAVRAALCMYRHIGEEVKRITPENYLSQRAYLSRSKKIYLLLTKVLLGKKITAGSIDNKTALPAKIEAALQRLSPYEQ
jgi:15-cis-phytoene synthase